LTEQQVLQTLSQGEMREHGLLPYSSNHSFLVLLSDADLSLPAVYKPQRGESALWDFEWGTLCKREAAAYLISTMLGWQLVPPTVLRQGTRGLGSVQFYVENDTDAHYFTVRCDARFSSAFRRIALFDFVINNADRKSGHCLVGPDGHIWAIDHGICFHAEFKLRTVIWEFSGQAIEPDLLEDIRQLRGQFQTADALGFRRLRPLLSREELSAMMRRTEELLDTETYPDPSLYRRNYPWPPI
jgi:uncharacterized repeat protein (TIGR03843 family)